MATGCTTIGDSQRLSNASRRAWHATPSRTKSVLLVGALFFYVFGVHFTFLPTYTSRIIVLCAWMYFFQHLLRRPSLRVNAEVRIVVALYVAMLSWVLLRVGMTGAEDTSILSSVLLLSVHAFVGGLFFAVAFRQLSFDFDELILALQVVIAVQAAFIILYFVSWQFREFSFAFIPPTGNIDYRENLFQSRGLTHSSGARLSLVQSFGLLFTVYLVAVGGHKNGRLFYLLCSCAVIVASVFLTGRTGLLMLPIALCYLGAVVVLRLRVKLSVLKFIVSIPIAFALTYFLVKLGYQHILGGFTTGTGEDGFDRLLRWVASGFMGEGQFQSRTAQSLLGHWFVPDDWRVFMFGDPATWSVNRVGSDVGFVRMLFGNGVIGFVIGYAFFLSLLSLLVARAKGLNAKLMLAMLGVFLVSAEAKEPFLMDLNVNAIVILLFCYVVAVAKPHSCSKVPMMVLPGDGKVEAAKRTLDQ